MFVKAGYIRVYQDVRGKYGSEGAYVMTRPPVGPLNPTKTDDTTDAWDTIDWLVKNVPESNGTRRHDRLVLRGLHRGHGAARSASGAEGRGAGEPDGRRLDGRRLVPLRRLPPDQHRLHRRADGPEGRGERSAAVASDDYEEFLQAGSAGDYARAHGLEQAAVRGAR